MRPRLLVCLGVLVVALSGCAATPAEDDLPDSAPAYSAAASPTTAPEATPDPVPVTTPTIPYDGDCDALLTAADVGTIVGQLSVLAPYEGARVPEVDVSAGTLGGLACEWYGDWQPRMMAFPVDLVPADIAARYTDVVCEGYLYDGYGCRVARTTGDSWVLTTLPVTGEEMSGELSADEQSVLDALADAFAGAVAADPGTPVDVTESWWAPDCATVAEQLDLPTLLGSTAVEEGFPIDGSWDVSGDITETAGTLATCDWYAYGDTGEMTGLRLIMRPGGAWAWDDLVAYRDDLGPVVIDQSAAGATDAIRLSPETAEYEYDHYLTDGVNIVAIETDYLPGDVDAAVGDIFQALAAG